VLDTRSTQPTSNSRFATHEHSNRRVKILAFSTDPDYDIRIRELLRELSPEFYKFERTRKWDTFRGIIQKIRRGQYDLVVMEGTGTAGGIAAIVGRILHGTKYIFSSGDAVAPFLAAKWPACRPIFNLYEKTLYRYSSGFIGWTPYLAGRALTMGASRAMTAASWAPYASDPTRLSASRIKLRQKLGIPENALVFGIIGRLAWSERLNYCYGHELVQATLRTDSERICALIVGDGDGKPRLEAMAGKALNHTIFLPGRVPRDQVPDYLSAMDVGSLPQSVDGVGSFRYTTKISEYFSVRLPFITNEIPAAYDFGLRWPLAITRRSALGCTVYRSSSAPHDKCDPGLD
jgi:glycosyltransferase involved in cell wall biosynthesis